MSLGVEFDLRNAHVPAPADARARLLRPPADRPAHVARDRRPAVRALLPRLRPGLHAPVGADDRPRRGGDVRRATRGWPRISLVARAVRGRHRRALRAPLAPGAAGGPAADRRADRRRRGEHLRRARRQGLRARGPPARALPRRASGASSTRRWSSTRLQAFYNPFIGFLPQLGLAAILLLRRPPGHRRAPDARRLHRVLRLPAHAAVADAHARHLARAGPARDGGRAPASSRSSTASRASSRRPARRRCRAGSGHVELRDVTLHYEGASRPALRDVDLDVPAGTTVALVGATGSGKTTLVAADPAALRRHRRRACSSTAPTCARSTSPRCARAIAVVDDDPFLFSATVAENIAYARAGRDARGDRARPRGAPRPTSFIDAPARTATTRGSASAG